MWIRIVGSLGFFCFFIYDINSITKNNKILQKFFMLGCLLVSAATAGILFQGKDSLCEDPVRALSFGAGALASFILLVYTLFFALPFQETYIDKNQKRKTYTEGIYALCRHPGVLWFACLYLCFAGMIDTRRALLDGLLLIFWNVVYIILQDRMIFPQTFWDYGNYQKTTPFLFPNRKSITRCRKTWRKEHT